MVQRIFLICGFLASVIYIGSDIYAAIIWQEYSFTSQSVSELRALGAPTRSMLVPVLLIYASLELLFGTGVKGTAGENRSLHTAGMLLVILGIVDIAANFFPMHLRSDIAAAESTLTDTMHIIATVITVLLILLIIWFGRSAGGRWFLVYTYVTIAIIFLCSVWSFMDAPDIGANLPTPWLGIRERINIYGYMVWMGVLSIKLFLSRILRRYNISGFYEQD